MRTVVNGKPMTADVPARTLLSDFLRHDCHLTGTHVGCEQGVCGACTVLYDGTATRSCLMLAAQSDGHEIETVESLAPGRDDALSPFQEAMRDRHGLQCGFCTPGILMSVTAALRQSVPVDEIKAEVLDGHVCRCTGYAGIRAAVDQAWTESRGAGR